MRKFFAFLTSSAIAACSLLTFGADAAEIGDYKPKLYFKTENSSSAQVLPNGTLYINKSIINTDEPITITASVYIEDELQITGNVIAKFRCKSEFVRLDGLTDPVAWGTSMPYAGFSTPSSMITNSEENFMSVQYYTFDTKPMPLTGEKSDDYPLAIFNANVSADAPYGSYEIFFMNEGSGKRSEIIYRSDDITQIIPAFYPGEYCDGLRINVSDRLLGDIDNNGVIDANDASSALTEYARASSNQESLLNEEQRQSADADGNGVVDGVDASNILSYYAYASTKGTLDFLSFLYERS